MITRRFTGFLLASLFLLTCFAGAAWSAERVAQLAKVTGDVSIQRAVGGMVEKASMAGSRVKNSSIYGGDVVTTSAASSAKVAFPDGTTVDLKEGTSLTIQEVDYSKVATAVKRDKPIGRTVRLITGSIWTKLNPNPKIATSFETPSGVAAVKGTEFGLTVDKNAPLPEKK